MGNVVNMGDGDVLPADRADNSAALQVEAAACGV